MVAWFAYPAVLAIAMVVVRDSALGWWTVGLLAVPAIATGALVRRNWMYLVPIVGVGVWMAIVAITSGPCETCDDTPADMALFVFVVLAGGSIVALAIGDLIASVWRRDGRGSVRAPLAVAILSTGLVMALADAGTWASAALALGVLVLAARRPRQLQRPR
ncbi:MAG: hypothetical protein JWL70_999 [Acidimicrobiia bacterium]|nr:hypothetical protein [Acidimicrobiia bacterium]